MTVPEEQNADIEIRPLQEADLTMADHVMRIAFGTFLGVPDPATFFGDESWVHTRWKADPNASFAAEVNGEIVGSVFAAQRGSFAFLGPLTIRPDVWNRRIGSRLMGSIMNLVSQWNLRLTGLFTFPHSPKHIVLYQKYGFWPRYLTAIMRKPVEIITSSLSWTCFSELSKEEKISCLQKCFHLTDLLFEGLDLTPEIRTIETQGLGDTVLLWDESDLVAFAACHQGPRTEAGSDTCYVKFAAVRSGELVAHYFDEILRACESFAASMSLTRLVAGINTARHEAYKIMLRKGFQIETLGIAMHLPNVPGFSRAGIYVLDDWR